MNAPVLPGTLNDNPVLERWVTFPAARQVTVNTGRVELGQGVLTAMAQIAARRTLCLDVARRRFIRAIPCARRTRAIPRFRNQSRPAPWRCGRPARRVRALFLDQAAAIIGCRPNELRHPRR